MADYRTQEFFALIRNIEHDLDALTNSVADLAALGRDIERDKLLANVAGEHQPQE